MPPISSVSSSLTIFTTIWPGVRLSITCAPIDLDAVIPEQMSPRQRGWLNDYHAFVRETLLPLMQDDDERVWLRHATRAI